LCRWWADGGHRLLKKTILQIVLIAGVQMVGIACLKKKTCADIAVIVGVQIAVIACVQLFIIACVYVCI
jgi:hypothetical protein